MSVCAVGSRSSRSSAWPKAAVLAVDQVLALTRSIEPANQFDVAANGTKRLNGLLELDTVQSLRAKCVLSESMAVSIAVAIFVALAVCPLDDDGLFGFRKPGDAAQSQPDLRGRRRLARVA